MSDKRLAVDVLRHVTATERAADPTRTARREFTQRLWVAASDGGTVTVQIAALTMTGRMVVLGEMTVVVPVDTLDWDAFLPKSVL